VLLQLTWIPVQTAYQRLQRQHGLPALQSGFCFRKLLASLCDLHLPTVCLPPHETVYGHRHSGRLHLLFVIFRALRMHPENSLADVLDLVGEANKLLQSADSTYSHSGHNNIQRSSVPDPLPYRNHDALRRPYFDD